jgi:tetratricopeptide (TPR) repeat protein
MMRYALTLVMLTSALAGRAQAQSADSSALAEQLFNQARELTKANKWAEACPKFEASLRYDPVLGTRLNLATCYEHIGKLASAWGLYRESMDAAKKAGDSKRADYAQKQATALEPRLPKLAISAPVNKPAGFVVKRDGTPIDTGELGVALYVDPGTHEVVASATNFEPYTVTVTLVEGKTETLSIPPLVAKPAGTEDKKPDVEEEVDTAAISAKARQRKFIALGLGGGGVVAMAVGFVFGAKASSSYDDAKKLCGNDLVCSSDNFAQGKKLVSDARSAGTISTVLVGVGVAAVAAGAVVYFTAPKAPERATARLTPVLHDGGAGLALTGTF